MGTKPSVSLIDSEKEGGGQINSLEILVASNIFQRVPVGVGCERGCEGWKTVSLKFRR